MKVHAGGGARFPLVLFSLAVLLMAPASAPAQEAPPPQAGDWSFLPGDAAAAVVAYPRRVLTSPEMKLMPIEVLSAVGKKEVGIDPLDVERVVGVLGRVEFQQQAPPEAAAIATLAKPYKIENIFPQIQQTAEKQSFAGGRTYYRGQWPQSPSMYMPDDRTLIVGADSLLREMARAKGEEGPLLQQVKQFDPEADIAAAVSVDAMRETVNQALQQAPPIPEPFAQFREAPEHLSAIRAQADMSADSVLELAFIAPDAESADRLEQLLGQALQLGKQGYLAQARQVELEAEGDPVALAAAQYMRRIGDHLFEKLQPTREGEKLAIRVESEGGAQINTATSGVLVALLLPAVQSAREAARRMQSQNNLKQMLLAMHNYHDTFRELPTNIADDEGKPLLSWRVRVLPFVEQSQLYDQFRLDEPWDSEHNLKLAQQMPAVYQNPNMNADNKTNYLAPVAKGTWFSLDEPTFADITDGTSNTIAIVEADQGEAVVWTKPQDLEVDLDRPLRGLGSIRDGGFSAAFLDGSVRFISNNIDQDVLKALFTAKGGEAVPNF